jgi:hypothetical protein
VVVGRRWRCRSNHAVAVAGAERIVQVGLARRQAARPWVLARLAGPRVRRGAPFKRVWSC